MPAKKKVPEKKVCPAKIIYIIEYDDSWDDDDQGYWNRADEIPVVTKLLKSGKIPAGVRWEENDRPFRRKEDAQLVVDAIAKTWPRDATKYRVAELICR